MYWTDNEEAEEEDSVDVDKKKSLNKLFKFYDLVLFCLKSIYVRLTAKLKDGYCAKSCDILVTQNTFMIYWYNVSWNKGEVNLVENITRYSLFCNKNW